MYCERWATPRTARNKIPFFPFLPKQTQIYMLYRKRGWMRWTNNNDMISLCPPLANLLSAYCLSSTLCRKPNRRTRFSQSTCYKWEWAIYRVRYMRGSTTYLDSETWWNEYAASAKGCDFGWRRRGTSRVLVAEEIWFTINHVNACVSVAKERTTSSSDRYLYIETICEALVLDYVVSPS